MPAATREHEITRPSELVDRRGELRQGAIGWSRTPLHTCELRGSPGRKKRWTYWAVMDDRFFFALTLADVDYLGLATASFVRMREKKLVERVAVTPFGRGISLPRAPSAGSGRFDGLGLHVGVEDLGDRVQLDASYLTFRGDQVEANLVVTRPAGIESVNVVVPWSARRFQYTSKQVALPAEGCVRVNGTPFVFGEGAFATLDYGCGIWPYRTTWNWGAASGVSEGRTIGMNLGGQWTSGTGMTENGVVVGGRAHKIGKEVTFAYDPRELGSPWRVRDADGARVDLTFTPEHTRRVRVGGGVVGSQLDHALGTYAGVLVLGDGERVRVEGLRGWAEEHRARW